MAGDDKSRRVGVKDGDQTVAAAEVARCGEGDRPDIAVSLVQARGLGRLRERAEGAVTRLAGSTGLADANLPTRAKRAPARSLATTNPPHGTAAC